MKAIGFKTSLPITDKDSFFLFEKEKTQPTGKELLVKIEATSVNPVDFKVRQNSAKDKTLEEPKVIGWDAIGTVEAIGNEVTGFKPGDRVFYAGDITKSGSNQEYELIDERIVGFAPKKISATQAAAMPLTSLTAWELLFDRMRISPEKEKGKTILIIGGAGGVGSIGIQLAKKIIGLKVVTTASRPESIEWCRQMGADYVVNHRTLLDDLKKIGITEFDFIVDFVDLNQYWDSIVALIKPEGRIGSISNPTQPIMLQQIKTKSVSFHWESMFTRSTFTTATIQQQQEILNQISGLLDNGTIQSTLTKTLKGFTVENLKTAHHLLESGKTIGKIVIDFGN